MTPRKSQEKIRELIKLAKEQGYLTFDDINDSLPNDIVDQQDYEAIMDRLRSMAFDIIDASDVDSYTDRTRINTEEEDEEEKLEAKMDILDDPGPHVPEADGPGFPAHP